MTRVRASIGGLSVFLLMAAGCGESTDEQATKPSGDDAEQVFREFAIHPIALTIEPSAMSELARSPKEWVRANMQVGGATYPDVGVRFKGHRSLRSWAQKPAFKLDFDKYKHKGRTILGMRGVALNNMVDDPSMLREQLGARVFAALGVPAPRASYAELTINGERFGLYTLLEAVDETFLAHQFGSGSGPMYEGEYGCDLYEQDVSGFEHDSGEDPEREQLAGFARAVSGPTSEWFLGTSPVVDRERVLTYLAASTLLADFDGYRHGHNYRIYRDPNTTRWNFIPWGFDRILKRDFGVFDSQGRVARRCYEDAKCRLLYVQRLHGAIRTFEKLNLTDLLQKTDAAIAAVVERDPRRPYSRAQRAEAAQKLAEFIAERPSRLRKQLGCWDGSREVDADGDGFGCMDCDDTNPNVHPGAVERCDGVDNDCSGHVDDGASCGCPVSELGTTNFALCDFPKTYWEAEQHCHALGYTLARIDSVEAMKSLQSAVQSVKKGEWWVGLSDQGHEGRYLWPDQSKPARGLWARGEPDNYVCGQHCAAMQSGRRGGLRDMHCATAAPFVCSVAPRDVAQVNTSTAR